MEGHFHSNPTGVEPWVLGLGNGQQVRIDIVDAASGGQTYGESYDYDLTLRERHGSPHPKSIFDRYHRILERGEHAGEFELYEPIDTRPEYAATWPASVETLLVTLTPSRPRSSTLRGVWGLIEAVGVEQPPLPPGDPSPNATTISLSLVYLANYDEYEDREAIETALEHPGLL